MSPLILTTLIVMAPANPRDAMESAIAVVMHQDQLLSSYEVEFSSSSLEAGSDREKQGVSHHLYRRSGARFYWRVRRSDGGGLFSSTEEELRSFDGRQARVLNTRGAASVHRAPPYDSGYFERVYGSPGLLSETLAECAEASEPVWEEREGRRLLKCWFKAPPSEHGEITNTYWLDPDAGWQPRLHESHAKPAPHVYPDGRQGSVLSITVRNFLRQNGVVAPAEVDRAYDVISRGGQRSTVSRERFALTSLVVSPRLSDDSFTVAFREGIRVNDVDRRVTYLEGEPGSEEPWGGQPPLGAAAAVTSSGARWRWWTDSRTWWSLCGLLLAGVGWMHWRSRRADE